MAHDIVAAEESAFDPGYFVDWKSTGVGNGDPLDRFTCSFGYEDDPQAIAVDIDATTVYVDRANRAGTLAGFAANCSLIRADNNAMAPIHLVFAQPVSAAGAHVSALTWGRGGLGKQYQAILTARMADSLQRYTVSVPFRLSNTPGEAPFIGMQVEGGAALVSEIWFDVQGETYGSPAPIQVVIDELWFHQ
ncbi:MAG: hypothetical protein QM772_15505 [Ottowia sp.]|uniref:hypothetical protein n=1 Tax=Ottowia sp. TaxID=1898956 RepID=UPI0039E6CA1B